MFHAWYLDHGGVLHNSLLREGAITSRGDNRQHYLRRSVDGCSISSVNRMVPRVVFEERI